MPNELKDVTVLFVSLVDKGANQKQIIWKSASAESPTFQRNIPIIKTDAVKHMVYGIVYSPDETDSEDDFMTAEEIEKTSYSFMKNKRTTNVDKQHDYNPDEGYVAESWIIRKNDPLFPDEPVGSWAVGLKIENDETWAQVEAGDITGLSMGGVGTRIAAEKSKTKNQGAVTKWLAKVFSGGKTDVAKDFASEYQNTVLRDAIWALNDALLAVLRDESVTDKKAAITANTNQFLTFIQGGFSMEKANAKTEKENKNTPAAEDVEKEEQEKTTEEILKDVSESVKTLSDNVAKMNERLEKVEKASPVHKSGKGGEEDEEEPVEKGFKGLKII